MKNRPYITGIIAVASPGPMFIFTIFWCWIWSFGIGLGILHYDKIPDWILFIGLLPLWISPLLGIAGLIHSVAKCKTKLAWLGILLSAMGLLENLLMLCGILYLSRY